MMNIDTITFHNLLFFKFLAIKIEDGTNLGQHIISIVLKRLTFVTLQ